MAEQPPVTNSGSAGGVNIHMSKGAEDDSYSKNSDVQKRIIEGAVIPNLDETLAHLDLPANHRPIILADLGHSSGPNSILLVSQIVDRVKERFAFNNKSSLEFQAFFNDLPSNDFNNLFHLLSSGDIKRSTFFSAGVPGSFFDPLFPKSSVDAFISTFALQFLSQMPASVVDKNAAAFNKGTWWASGRKSSSRLNKEATNAFKKQNVKDMDRFLKIRAAELVPGGLLCFAVCTRWDARSSRVETSLETCFRCVDSALEKVTREGAVNVDCIDFFNMPMYFHTTGELEQLILKYHSTFEVVTCKEIKLKPFVDAGYDESSLHVMESVLGMVRGAFSEIVCLELGEEAASCSLNTLKQK